MHQLVRDNVSRDTVTACEQLLEAAKDGHVVGIAFVLLLRRGRYLVNCAGQAAKDPTLTRGALLALDDELRELVRGRVDSSTTLRGPL